MNRRRWLVMVLVAATFGGVVGCGVGDEPATGGDGRASLEALPGAIYDPPRPAPALRLTGADGRAFDLAAERGHVVLLFFGFTQCPDICPSTLRRWVDVRASLGADSSRVRFVFVSIDPENDTPSIAAAYARKFDPSFVGLSGTTAEIRQVALAWNVPAERVHSSQVFVVNPDGLIPWGYGRSAEVKEIVRGLRAVMWSDPGRA